MAQSLTQIQQAFDTALLAAIAALTLPIGNITQILTFLENKVIPIAALPDMTTKLGVRSTLIPAKTAVETLGPNGYVSVRGNYAIDVFGQVNTGSTQVQLLSDAILAAFPRSMILALTNGDQVQVQVSGPSVNTNQGGWTMGKLYARQIIVEYLGYIQP